jgi:hypothetical protein
MVGAKARTSSNTPLNDGSGARHQVRYVSRKGMRQIGPPPGKSRAPPALRGSTPREWPRWRGFSPSLYPESQSFVQRTLLT